MKVKVGNEIFDSEQVPIMIIFDNESLDQVKNMGDGLTRYASVPEGTFDSAEKFSAWMKES